MPLQSSVLVRLNWKTQEKQILKKEKKKRKKNVKGSAVVLVHCDVTRRFLGLGWSQEEGLAERDMTTGAFSTI